MKKYYGSSLLLLLILYLLEHPICVSAQPKYYYISICKTHKALLDKGLGKCLTCYQGVSYRSAKAKICDECWVKRGGLWDVKCYICEENIVGGDYARVCEDCAAKDECVVCKKKLQSRSSAENDGRRVVGRYSIQVTIPGEKEKFLSYWDAGAEAFKNQQYEEALNYFNKCNEIIPNGTACQIGMCLRGLDRNEEAIKYFDIAIDDDPTFSDPFFHKGIALITLGKVSEAELPLKKAIELNTQESNAYLMYAFILETEHKDFDRAAINYERGFTLSPNATLLRGNLIELYRRLGKFGDALRHAEAACSLTNNSIEALNTKAELLFNTSRWNDAIETYEQIISLKPNNVHIAYYFLGLCQFQLKKYDEARENWLKTVELDENKNPETYSCLACCEAKLNNKKAAAEYSTKALERLKNESSFVYYNLACAYSLIDNIEKSLEMLENALKTGQINIAFMESDEDLKNVRSSGKYSELLSKYRSSNFNGTN